MCLAVPAKVITAEGEEALVEFGGNRLKVSTVLTPGAAAGEWVLVHAGFAIATLDEAEALKTWDYLRQARWEGVAAEAGAREEQP